MRTRIRKSNGVTDWEGIFASQAKKQNGKSKLREQPCRDYSEDGNRPGHCESCWHTEAAHEEDKKQMKTSKPKVITSGNISRIASADSLNTSLDSKFYILEMNMQGFYLTEAEPFQLPRKVYGDAVEKSERILKTYVRRGDKSMGVMCSGRPGTGKTVLSKVCANMACQSGMPVIIIRQGFFGPAMSSFLESLPNKCLMFVDEIEKAYESEEARNWLLSVLDGTVMSSHLWLSTCNDPHIGMAFESRPGRIRYHYKFEQMPMELVKGMIEENIRSKAMRKAVFETAERIANLTPDILFSIIEECLIHNEKPSEFMDFLNVDTSIPDSFSMKGFVRMIRETPENEQILENMVQLGNDDEKRFARYCMANCIHAGLNDFSRHYEDFFEKSLIPIESFWVSCPISFDNAGKLELDMRIDIEKRNHNIQWDADEIRKTEFKNGAITIYGPEDGEVVFLKPTRSSRLTGMMAL